MTFEHFYEEASHFSEILLKYKLDGTKYIDPNFHPSLKILEKKVSISESFDDYKRLDELYKAKLFQRELINQNNIQQGNLGDCYFVSALSCIAKQPYLIKNFFETDLPDNILGPIDDSVNIECGAVVVYFNAYGRLIPVLIDTLMPVKNGRLRFCSPSDPSKSPWFCLVEKAYAKLNGSYSNISGGLFYNGIYSLLGYYPKRKNLAKFKKSGKPDDFIIQKIMKYQSDYDVIGTSIQLKKLANNVTEQEVKDRGLILKHCYYLVKIRQINEKTLICLRNPWGSHEWNGDWSDKSSLWTPELKSTLNWEDKEDGTFWMCAEDYLKYFTEICLSVPIPPTWHLKRFEFQFTPGEHDGQKVNKISFQITDNVPSNNKCCFYLLVEKKRNLHDNNTESVKYVVEFNHNNDTERFRTSKNLVTFPIVVNGKETVMISFNRLKKCDLITNCYVLVFCKHEFTLTDLDNPGRKFEEDENNGYIINNYSKNFPVVPPSLPRTQNARKADKHANISEDFYKSSKGARLDIHFQEIFKRKKLTVNSNIISHLNDKIKMIYQENDKIKNDNDSLISVKNQQIEELNSLHQIIIDNDKEIDALKNQLMNLNKENENKLLLKNHEIENLQLENIELRKQIRQCKSNDHEFIRNENKHLKIQIEEMKENYEKQLITKKQEIAKINFEKEQLRVRMQNMKDNYEKQSNANKKAVDSSNSEKEKMRKQFNEMKGYYQRQISANNQAISKSNNEKEELRKQIDEIRENYEKQLKSKNLEIMRINNCNDQLRNQTEKMREDYERQLNQNTETIENSKIEIEKLKKQMTEIRKNSDRQISANNQAISKANNEKEELRKQIDEIKENYEKQLKIKNLEIMRINNCNDNLRNQTEKMREDYENQITANNETINNSNSEIEKLRKQIKSKNQEIAKIYNDKEQLSTIINQLLIQIRKGVEKVIQKIETKQIDKKNIIKTDLANLLIISDVTNTTEIEGACFEAEDDIMNESTSYLTNSSYSHGKILKFS